MLDKKRLKDYEKLLLQIKSNVLNGGLFNSQEGLTISPDDLADETDLASNVITQNVTFNIKNRELHKLRMVDAALHRIKEGTYGYCLDCDEEIGHKRLVNQPWTELCIIHAEERERGERSFLKQA